MTQIIMDHGVSACFGTSLAPTDLTLIFISARTADISKSFSRFRGGVLSPLLQLFGGRRAPSAISYPDLPVG